MSRLPSRLCTTVLLAALAAPSVHAEPAPVVDIPFEKFQLDNGLTVVVHEDHKAPVVAVSVWYHVGSADEPAGKTGFAHLYEHLMFEGSENHPESYFRPFEQVGATDMNGTTANDRTNYFETVPTTALDMALWMESDRMGHLLNAIGQAELDKQRGVVQNEKRQDENQPYGRADENIQANAFPANHPYHHDTIGSMQDLNAASLGDVKQWFKDYYGAANTTVVLAGDIAPAQARSKMQVYFGDIPAGPPVARQQPWVAERNTSTRGEMRDQVAQTRIVREWNVPPSGDAQLTGLNLAATVLGGGKTSRLYTRLVYQDKLADDVSVGIEPFALASLFELEIDVKNGADAKRVEAVVAQEWQRFLREGPTQDELDRARIRSNAAFVRGLEKVNGKAIILASGQLYRDDPGAWHAELARQQAATPASVLAAAQRWIARGDYTLTIRPGAAAADDDKADTGLAAAPGAPAPQLPPAHDYRTVSSAIDRSHGVPVVSDFPDLSFPSLQRGKLRNGIEVVLAERHSIPVVQFDLLFDGGYAADQGRKLGTGSFTSSLLDEGTQTLDSLAVARARENLGAVVATGCTLDTCSASLNALDTQLDASLALFTDIVRHPAFRDADIARIRGQWLAGIAQEKTEPTSLALRVLPPLLYGAGHAYAIPFTGTGTRASIESLNAGDLRVFARDYLRPDNLRILVAGDTTLAAILPKLEASFGDWKTPPGALPKRNLASVALPPQPRVFLLDRPGSQQSLILAGELAPSTRAPDNLEIKSMSNAFGGIFTSRLNMNLRDAKHWAYGAGSFLPDALGQRPFMLYAPVQTDQTAPAVAEIVREARELIGSRPLSDEEIRKVKNSDIRSLPGAYESTAAVLGSMRNILVYGRPDDYVQTLKQRIEAQADSAIQAAATEVVRPQALTWVVVGDLAQIEKPLRALKLGPVKVIDADGHVVR